MSPSYGTHAHIDIDTDTVPLVATLNKKEDDVSSTTQVPLWKKIVGVSFVSAGLLYMHNGMGAEARATTVGANLVKNEDGVGCAPACTKVGPGQWTYLQTVNDDTQYQCMDGIDYHHDNCCWDKDCNVPSYDTYEGTAHYRCAVYSDGQYFDYRHSHHLDDGVEIQCCKLLFS
ncbi:MAG: hypothetical protein ACI8RD_012643 [Bacillariaceae sp.]|jgi:hypothetical protein